MVIGRADDHGLDVLLIEHLAPVPVGLGLGEDLQRLLGAVVVDVAQRHDVLVPEHVVVRGSAAPYADEGDVQLVAGGVLAAQRAALQNGQARCGAPRTSANHVVAWKTS